MIKKYNNLSLLLGAPGLVLQFIGLGSQGEPEGAAISAIGSLLLIAGLAFYAKAKGRSAAWGLMGLLSLIGLIVLGSLPDRAKTDAVN